MQNPVPVSVASDSTDLPDESLDFEDLGEDYRLFFLTNKSGGKVDGAWIVGPVEAVEQ